jgi:hypothetical protein
MAAAAAKIAGAEEVLFPRRQRRLPMPKIRNRATGADGARRRWRDRAAVKAAVRRLPVT